MSDPRRSFCRYIQNNDPSAPGRAPKNKPSGLKSTLLDTFSNIATSLFQQNTPAAGGSYGIELWQKLNLLLARQSHSIYY